MSLVTGKMTDQPVTLADGLTVLNGFTSSGTTTLSSPLPVPSGGQGSSTLAVNGVLYGNSSNPVGVTAAGPANSVFVSTSSAVAPAFSQTPTVGTLTATTAVNADSGRGVVLINHGSSAIAFRMESSTLGILRDLQQPDYWWSTFTDSSGIVMFGGSGNPGTNALLLNGFLKLATNVSMYNNIGTAGWGVPAIYASARVTGQTGANASVATYTVGGGEGSFVVSGNINITAFTAGTVSMNVAYTDETNAARTAALTFSSITGTLGLTAGAAGAFEGVPLMIRCKASTTITFASTVNLFTGTYNAEGMAAQVA